MKFKVWFRVRAFFSNNRTAGGFCFVLKELVILCEWESYGILEIITVNLLVSYSVHFSTRLQNLQFLNFSDLTRLVIIVYCQ